jgi:hypothetical protein
MLLILYPLSLSHVLLQSESVVEVFVYLSLLQTLPLCVLQLLHLQILSESLLIAHAMQHLHPLLILHHLLLKLDRLLKLVSIAQQLHPLVLLPVSLHSLPYLTHLQHPDSVLLLL